MSGKVGTFNSRLLELVSDRTGVIKSVSRVPRGVDEPNPPVLYQATISHFDFRKADKSERVVGGKGLTENDAIAAAIEEAVERYCASHVDLDRTTLARWVTVEHDGIAPPEFVLYSAKQYARRDFPYHRWNEEDEVRWLTAYELPRDRAVLVPASLIYLTSHRGRAQEYLCPSTSNGLAVGPNLETAILNGIFELIERDGFLIHWMNRLAAPEVEYPADDGLADSIRSHYRRFGVEVRVFNVTTDLPAYVLMGLALDTTGRGPAALVGLGCDLDPGVALLKSVMEICKVRPGEKRRYLEEPPSDRLKNYEDVRRPEDHRAFLSNPERIGEFGFLLRNGRRKKIEELPHLSKGSVHADLSACVSALSEHGYRVVYAELTTPDVIDYGLRVVRVLITGLQPLHFGYGEERLGGSRLFEVPQQMGLAVGPNAENDPNPCPHPLG
jgi:ribosomal protein S12 methylthiotransferase accessory factor